MSSPRIAHLSIGDELLTGRHPDLDAPIVARALGEHGLALHEVRVLPDEEALLVPALRELRASHDLVVTSGGLGPTLDDLTRHAVAAAWGVDLEERDEAWEQIRVWFAGRGIDPPEANRRQALIPRGAQVLANGHGTAPGFFIPANAEGSAAISLPGPPRELEGMLADGAAARIASALGSTARTVRREVSLFGLPESTFGERVADWMARGVEPRMGVSAREGVLVVSVSSSAADAEARVEGRLGELRARLEPFVFADGDRTLDAVLVERLLAAGTTLATAESCTGGRVAASLTRHAGVSAVFREGAVTYSNEAKQRTLGVPESTLATHGAVSRATAAAMARGIVERTGADLGVAITGIAGPDG
ncbi:MAG: nicotinamide-nucleotide amidohydrolase family protein, partial [Planctomycetota bacterium]